MVIAPASPANTFTKHSEKTVGPRSRPRPKRRREHAKRRKSIDSGNLRHNRHLQWRAELGPWALGSGPSAVASRLHASLSPPAALSAQNWPSFRGLNAAGVADGHPAPVKWNATTGEGVLWKTPIPGVAVSSPIIWGDRVRVHRGQQRSEGRHPHRPAWRRGAGERRHPSFVASVRARSADRKGCVGARRARGHAEPSGIPSRARRPRPRDRRTACDRVVRIRRALRADFTGKLLWKRDLGVLNAGWFYDPDYEWGIGSSPIIWRNMVIVQCDIQKNSFIAAFDVASGEPIWRTPREEIPSWSTPTIVESFGRARLVTQATGFTRGYTRAQARSSGDSPAIPKSRFQRPSSVRRHHRDERLSCVQPITAIRPGAKGDVTLKGTKRRTTPSPGARNGADPIPTPVIYQDHLHPSGQRGRRGARRPDRPARLPGAAGRDAGGSFSASPVAADGKLYFASEDGDM